ncbi:MAG: efflux RND transporter periplasmic adaptor subunit [Acidobacteria bacterium]|nr:efflux RND transporter periplasmic adaptor subunit [Acidobacteriota bacterium]
MASEPAPTVLATVAVVQPQPETMSQRVVLAGEFRPHQVVDLYAKVAGYLRQISVDVGSVVQPGQVVAVLESPELETDVARTGAELRRSRAERERAQAEVRRAQASLHLTNVSLERLLGAIKREPGIIAQQEIDEARARQQAAEALLEAAQAAASIEDSRIGVAQASEKRSQAMAAYQTITAPFAGVVVKRYVDRGAMVQAGTASQTQASPVVRVAELNPLRLAVSIPEAVVPLVKVGVRAEIRVSALRQTFTGTVARINREVAVSTRTMEAELDVPNPGSRLTPGMFADVSFQLERREQVLTIPINAVINGGGNRSVLVVGSGGKLEERSIKTGLESSSRFEVIEGLRPDDQVVVSNRSQLRPGQTVEVRRAGGR